MPVEGLERVTLDSGVDVNLRALCPGDRVQLASGLRALSPSSRYHRFFTEKPQFTARELDYLTQLDGINHYAIAAGNPEPPFEGWAVARFVRLPDEPDTAESAITVIDAAQGRGLGRLLMSRLIQAATERGIKRLRNEFLSENVAFRRLMERLWPGVRFEHHGTLMVGYLPCPLPGAPPSPG